MKGSVMEKINNLAIILEALKISEMIHQLQEIDVEDGLHDGTPEGIRKHYTDEELLKEVYYRCCLLNDNREPDGSWNPAWDDPKKLKKEYGQMKRLVTKWRNKIKITDKTLNSKLDEILQF
jgi:hypothetical protein